VNKAEEILKFWFQESSEKWWIKDEAFDRSIRERFEGDLKRAAAGAHEDWKTTPRPCLAYIILLDQFSRNIYRNTPRAFAQDPIALRACLDAVERGLDQSLSHTERIFLYMPMMHSEEIAVQRRGTEIFRKLADEAPAEMKASLENNYSYALRHAEIIERFGRFPHRNQILGRTSTPEEIEFLKQPGSSF
jgi:uncharacterized protein (DUF924 family)